MPDTLIIPDTSCLIYLEKIGEIELFQKLYSRTVVTKEVAVEYIEPLPVWIEVKKVEEVRYQKVLEQKVDIGEASIMILALERKDAIVCIDDKEGRMVAKTLGIKLTGTLGIIYKAKQEGLIDSVRDRVEKLKKYDFRISKRVEQEIIRMAGE